jgi:N-acetylglucosamine-6-phosphate deacetylase
MFENRGRCEMRKTSLGRIAGTSSIAEVDYDGTIQGVNELIQPPELEEYITPGFIDLQVNGFAGVDYNDPSWR